MKKLSSKQEQIYDMFVKLSKTDKVCFRVTKNDGSHQAIKYSDMSLDLMCKIISNLSDSDISKYIQRAQQLNK